MRLIKVEYRSSGVLLKYSGRLKEDNTSQISRVCNIPGVKRERKRRRVSIPMMIGYRDLNSVTCQIMSKCILK